MTYIPLPPILLLLLTFFVEFSATNYERHLPMEEAFPDTGFDTSQFHSYMEQNFR